MRLRRALLIAAAGLLLVLVSFALLDRFFFSRLREKAETGLSGAISAPVSIRSLSVSLFKGVVLKDLVVTVSNRPLARLEGLSLRLKTGDLLRGALTFERIGIEGVEIVVSDATNDSLPYLKALAEKLTPVPGREGPKLPLRLNLQTLKVKDVNLTFKGRRYGLDSASAAAAPGRIVTTVVLKDIAGIAGVKAEITRFERGLVSFSGEYRILDRGLRAYADGGTFQGNFTNTGLITVTNATTGRDLALKACAVVRPSAQSVELRPGLNTLVYKGRTLRFGGGLKDFRRLLVRGTLDAEDLSVGLLVKDAEGSMRLSVDLEGSLSAKKFSITRGLFFSDSISLSGVLSNGLALRDLKASIRANRLTQLDCTAWCGELSARLKARTGDLSARPLEIFLDAEADRLSPGSLKFVRQESPRAQAGTNGTLPLGFVLNAKAAIRAFVIGGYTLTGLAAEAVLAPDRSYKGKCSFLFDEAVVKGRFDGSGGSAGFDASVAGFNAAKFAPGVTSSLDAAVSGRYDGGRLALSADLSADRISYRDLALTSFGGRLTLDGDDLRMTNGRAVFFGGRIRHSIGYDLRRKKGAVGLEGEAIDVKSLYHHFVPDPGSEFTGKAVLDLHLDIESGKKPSAAGRVTLSKGIIQDTKLQKQISAALLVPENQCVNYVLYDTISLDFGTDLAALDINGFKVYSSDLEFALQGRVSLKEKNAGRLAIDLLVSEACVQEFPNPHQFVVSAIARKEVRWSLIRFLWNDGATKLVKPGK
jgi:hypothetical protein